MTEKEQRKAVKALHDKILASAFDAAFFKQLVGEVQDALGGDPKTIFDRLGSMLGTAIWHIAMQEPMEEWKRQAEVSVMCLGELDIDLDGFYRLTQTECKREIDAFFYVDSSMKLGVDVKTIAEQLPVLLEGHRPC